MDEDGNEKAGQPALPSLGVDCLMCVNRWLRIGDEERFGTPRFVGSV